MWGARGNLLILPPLSFVCMYDQLLQLCLTLTVAHQAPLCMGFSRQKYWSGFPCPPPGDLPYPGITPMSPAAPALQADYFTC